MNTYMTESTWLNEYDQNLVNMTEFMTTTNIISQGTVVLGVNTRSIYLDEEGRGFESRTAMFYI